nr:MAG TPA: hypothetical protein [Caudoviricetes sp.]
MTNNIACKYRPIVLYAEPAKAVKPSQGDERRGWQPRPS